MSEWITHAAPLIERFEGMARLIPGGKVEAYPDPASGGDPWTIGIGSTRDEEGNPVKPGDVWTIERAHKRLEQELDEIGRGVTKLLAGKKTSPKQFAAMVSFVYNLGIGNFSGSSVLKYHRAGDYARAADRFLPWNKARVNGVLKEMRGLTRRRQAERKLYLEGS